MRHITDGELHAYLDGALSHLPEGRGDEVRHHLEECAACRERLKDEEEIRAQAEDLLGRAALGEVSLPSFEELRARAEASKQPEVGEEALPHRRGPLRGLPLAWAATVVLALGVGWMGGEIWRTTPRPIPTLQERIDPALRPASTSDVPGVEERVPGVTLESRTEAESPAEGDLDTPLEGGRAGRGVEADELRPGGETNPAAPESLAGEAGRATRVREPSEERAKAGGLPVEALQAQVARRRTDSLAPTPSAALVSPPLPLAREAEEGGADALLESVAGSEEGSMAVPGLDLLAVEWEEWAPGERALYIRQLLPTGDTLELRYLGLFMGSDPDAASSLLTRGWAAEEAPERPLSPKVMEASLPPGWNQVVMRWGRGWLVARAPLPEESLRGFLRSLH